MKQIVALLLVAASCKKMDTPPVEYNPPVTDARTIRLKEILVEKLPPPYFHFAYTDSGYVSSISFADSLFNYEVEYKNNRVSRMANKSNQDTLVYTYTGNQVSSIVQRDLMSCKRRTYTFYYNSANQLTEASWYRFDGDNTADSTLERKILLIYGPDKNLSKKLDYRMVDNSLTLSFTSEYSNYDNGTNVDDFYLFKDFFEHLLYLPQVKMQLNNPRLVNEYNATNEYKTDYTYTYVNGLPTTKNGTTLQVRGSQAGEIFSFINRFSYY